MFLVTFAAGGGYTADFAEASLAPDRLSVTLSDPKSLPASGVVGTDAAQPIPRPQVDVDKLLPGLDNNLGFVDLKDGDTLPIAQTRVRVKGQAGSSFKLSANGSEVSRARVGKKAVLAEQRLLVWEYIGIPLKAGRNTLTVRQIDPFGNERGMRSISVTGPDRLGRIETHLPEAPIADGHTALPVTVRLTDAKAVPVTGRTPLTEATAVRWQVEDLDPREPGVQVFIDGGKAEYRLLPPDLFESNKRVAALGGDYQFSTRGRVYARHELISSLSSPFALNQLQENHNTVIGIDTDYMKDANLFSEYRARDAFDGRSSGAAIGTRNAWHLFEGLTLHTSAEQVKALESAGAGFDSDSQAYTAAIEYTGHPLWKASGRVESYHASNAESWLSTLGLAHKLSRDWTFLGRSILVLTDSEGAAGASLQHRRQLGVAYRDTETNVWNALARYEHKYEDGSPRVGFGLNTTGPSLDLQRTVDAVSLHYNYQPERSWVVSGRIAAKYVQEDSFGIKSGYDAELLMGRYTMDLTERWDIGLQASALAGEGFESVQFGFGPELGYRVADNLWSSAGYNLFGFEDEDLSADEHTDQGVYARLRFKFDEELFKPVMDLLK
ncbi:MAG: hypothetical protein USCGTAYLOR_02806 [Chromatiales bacterium USCg_Taylor]|nr:MAG: hypothetical protein USCGTAYLOR_02806 [Chromatiales bacterium USCg_Taylor]